MQLFESSFRFYLRKEKEIERESAADAKDKHSERKKVFLANKRGEKCDGWRERHQSFGVSDDRLLRPTFDGLRSWWWVYAKCMKTLN